ncbi:Cell differentiation family, Rcd1-like containing protein [Histomonas meleagridis]|uniref:Cell differentiation family, Rcd1-like containing protein n=1 Tax=Histomonas meleagridis TaxID=135588 RepID=UPI00355A7F20|nr:Cell differentiation family, Rcd1-like containing protein [Histomonas meleagridis]KAH0797840.1 Cell differentiation family, Rcd1-like containing protein [Histomonas meleagridis]
MKLASLGIFSDLLLDDSQEIIDYYIQIDLIPILLKILKYGTDVTQIVSAFILDKIISNAHGIESICSDIEKIASVVKVLSEVVVRLCKNFVPNLSKYIVNSFNALIEKDKAKPIIVSMWNNSFKDIQATEACSEEFINMLYTLKSGC